ncbi:hypothetical protein EELLY_v1c03790 [Entomoplasma ellychniae]|uniref:Lipoprotein n=1 Tax=Entomoplasma ellychniae TaxID=2114 RepID=A0A8E2QYP0_9MOLU|nr:lipoprotein [Entomoplasma ellychniae]PPE04340.1 hypothetical protein EELLY_v1c00140 [Entomoplasma ellychniae]PPE04628.1 hypothetical protein EELLY_v1c03080 [Entomoplasma ellychniae]PPE04699.1 hypothetical protein EELLY_v1c03790 [Entomoplasma ellychniae]
MKKILSIIAAFSLTVTSSFAVVACNKQIKIVDIKRSVSHIQNKTDINEVNQELIKVKVDGVKKIEAFEIENNETDVTIKISVVEGRKIDSDNFVLTKAIADKAIDNPIVPDGEYEMSFEEYIKNFSVTTGAEQEFHGDWNIDYFDLTKNQGEWYGKTNKELKQWYIDNQNSFWTWDKAIAQSITGLSTKWYDYFLDKDLFPEGFAFIDNLLNFESSDFFDTPKSLDTPSMLNGKQVTEVDGYYEVSMTTKAVNYLKEANQKQLLKNFNIDSEDSETVNEFNEGFNIVGSIKINFIIFR